MTSSKELMHQQTSHKELMFPPHEEEEHDRSPLSLDDIPYDVVFRILVALPTESVCTIKCVSRWLYELLCSPYFVRVHFLTTPSHPSNCVALISIYSGWFFLSISSFINVKPKRLRLVKPPVGERLLEHPITSNGVVCYKAYPDYATTIVYNPATNKRVSVRKFDSYQSIRAFFFDPATENFMILVQTSDFGHSGYSIFNSAIGLWKSIANPFQLTYEGSILCVDSVCYVLEKFIRFDMFAFNMISEEWVRIPLPCDSCPTCFRKLIEWGGQVCLVLDSGSRDLKIWKLREEERKWEKLIDLHLEKRSRIPSGTLKMERFSIIPYRQQSLFIVRGMNASIEVDVYDIGNKTWDFSRRFFWRPRVHDLACPQISPFAPTILRCK
ncbi:F-box protein At5g65850 [Amborella trichopoda]|uniref:F-box domain-containing protein n=1 Tax=Amborella trichopoda TaxID=13333 RepID=W1Q058_AMBTC|nr:F-box protein At5g65850 [Amborella trichopoda]ERN13741.1 hypothetical protein AMTR_s00049p00178220 [Amborella trichopoda]|eukprot:XP_006852274.1 F-box protein At5g65850 [Amborella trichopoda]